MKSLGTIALLTTLVLSLYGCATGPVQEATSSIDKIGEVTLDSLNDIESAQEKYDTLTDSEKNEVKNSEKLKEARARFNELSAEKQCFDFLDSELGSYCSTSLPTTSIIENAQARTAALKKEADALASFDTSKIEDDSFKSLFDNYIQSLSNQIEGLSHIADNVDSYNLNYIDNGVIAQNQCLSNFRDSFNLETANTLDTESLIRLSSPGTFYSVELNSGTLEISVESLTIDQESTAKARQFDGYSNSQDYGLLLCSIKNDSVQQKNDSLSNWLDLSSAISVVDPGGTNLSSPNFSYSYPGYKIATGGYLEIPAPGTTEKIAMPFTIDSETTDAFIKLSSGQTFIEQKI